jgi:phage-related protein
MSVLPLPPVPGLDFPVAAARTPALLGLRFGDSYRQECQDGIFGEKQTDVSVIWSKLTTQHKVIIDSFLRERGGYQSFSYSMPRSITVHTYICKTWKCTEIAFNNWTISASWSRVPDYA